MSQILLVFIASVSAVLHDIELSATVRHQMEGVPVGSPAADGPSLLLAGFVAVFAFAGWRVGVRRQAYVLVLSALLAWLAAALWPELIVDLERAFPALSGVSEPVVFLAGVSGAYLSSRLVRAPIDQGLAALQNLPSLLDRLMGAALGSATGYLSGGFVLPRIIDVPAATYLQSASGYETSLHGAMIWLVIAVLILFGVASLSPGSGESQ